MKILWICNVPNKDASEYMQESVSVYGGWLTGQSAAIKNKQEVELVYSFPCVGKKTSSDFFVDGIHYYPFYVPPKYGFLKIDANKMNEAERIAIRRIIVQEKPDIVHIFGTEYIHALIAAEEAQGIAEIVCSIQGMTSVISKHFLSFVPPRYWFKINFATLLRGTLWTQRKDLERRGTVEKKTLQLCSNVIGRTQWDMVSTRVINPDRKYYLCNETLRESFYKSVWQFEQCVPFSIFVSQGSSPLKGLNILLQAVCLLKDEFPNITVRIAGNSFIQKKTFKQHLTISTYGEYIEKLISMNKIAENIEFVGQLDEKNMVSEYLRCNVFASASSIENSSNSVCEAMLLGVPVVSSFVGGIPSLIENEKEGLFYQGDAAYMAAEQIRRLFLDAEFASELGKNARQRALETHNPEKNTERLLEIYKSIYLGRDNGSN